MTYDICLDPDRAQQNVRSDLEPNCLTLNKKSLNLAGLDVTNTGER